MAPPRSISCIIRISSLNFLSRCGFSQGWLQSWATLNPLIFHVTPYVFIYLSIYLSILSYLILSYLIYLSIYLYIYSIIYTYTDIGSPLQMDHATCFFSGKGKELYVLHLRLAEGFHSPVATWTSCRWREEWAEKKAALIELKTSYHITYKFKFNQVHIQIHISSVSRAMMLDDASVYSSVLFLWFWQRSWQVRLTNYFRPTFFKPSGTSSASWPC